MNTWLSLLYKEYRMSRTSFLIKMGMLFIVGSWMLIFLQRYPPETDLIFTHLITMMVVITLFYLPVFMLFSISRELKHAPHLWLHCPQPTWVLLSAKLVTGLAYMLVLILVESIFLYWLFISYSSELIGMPKSNIASFITGFGAYILLAVVNYGLYVASWATLIAVVNARGRNLWPTVLAAFFAATWGINRLEGTWFFEKLTQWGAIQRDTLLGNFNISFAGSQIYTGETLFYLILTISLFALSAWLINRKVEV